MTAVTSHTRRTKIVATIGPALVEPGGDRRADRRGHGRRAPQHVARDAATTTRARAELVREAEKDAGRPIALIADLQGPKLRDRRARRADVVLERGESVVIAGEDAAQRRTTCPSAPAVLGSVLQPGNDVLIDDGHVRLRVESVERGAARCAVVVGGDVSSHKGVNLPGVPLPIPSLTRKDLDDLDVRARVRRRLRRALVRPLRVRREGALAR